MPVSILGSGNIAMNKTELTFQCYMLSLSDLKYSQFGL